MVATRHAADAQIHDRVTVALLHVWKFRKFSDSRWVTLGPSMRTLLASLLLGLKEYVDYCIGVAKCKPYYIKGLRRLDDRVKRMLGMAATASFVSDATLLATLEDDRLAVRVAEIDRLAEEEMD